MGQEVFCLIADNLAAVEQAAKVCERRIMARREKILSIGVLRVPARSSYNATMTTGEHR
jgi:hypothetical protein